MPNDPVLLSRVYHEILKARKQGYFYIVNQGGTSSTKTFSTLQYLIALCRKSTGPLVIDIAGGTLPDLKRGVLRDLPTVFRQFGLEFDNHFNRSDYSISAFGSLINLVAIDKLGKAKGGRRDYLFLNEADNINKYIAEQLMARTRKAVFIDYNPTCEFWAHELLQSQPKACLIKSTYKDNPHLEQNIIDFIESRKSDVNWFRVYGLGETGKIEEIIYKDYTLIDAFPDGMDDEAYGLDFGFNNPSAMVRVGFKDGSIYLEEVFYQTGLLTRDISALLIERGFSQPEKYSKTIYADCAEPDRIEELYTANLNVTGAEKDVALGIDCMKGFKIHVVKSSANLLDELRRYRWKKDKEGRILDEPVKVNDHALDAARYGVFSWCKSTGYTPGMKK